MLASVGLFFEHAFNKCHHFAACHAHVCPLSTVPGQAVKITDIHEGLDFFFGSRAHALKLVDFLQSVVPIRFRADKQLVSHDTHNNTYNYKYTFSVEIAPVCKVCAAGWVAISCQGHLCCRDRCASSLSLHAIVAILPPLIQDDLICLPAKLASSLGGIGPLVLCTKVTNQITLLDPATLR
jgi:nonsense-mediated mRNA decay protein 3